MESIDSEAQEERLSLELALAAGLAELSAEEAAPTGVQTRSPFRPEDVVFTDSTWVTQALRVQDWLWPSASVSLSAPPAQAAVALLENLGADSEVELLKVDSDRAVLTDLGLEFLRDRVDRAVELMSRFRDDLEAGSIAAATKSWVEGWDETVEETIGGTINAKSEVWWIADFTSRAKNGKLNLSPSYQRGDVWPTKDSQLLIESVVRGIPLPSIIILRPTGGSDTPYEVVDGKQRLTAILRFVGAHPKALELVRRKDAEFPTHRLLELFKTNYPAFRRAWRNATLEALSTAKEAKYYFPFKLSSKSPTLSGELEVLRGKYYHSIKDLEVTVGGGRYTVEEVFEHSTDYKIPIIEYVSATPRQIHDVFSLYNKQGKHLNAEEIRNAVYHEVDLMRALAVASGDLPDVDAAAGFLQGHTVALDKIEVFLKESRVGDARYKRTKILSWLCSTLLLDSMSDDGKVRRLSTAKQINALLDRIQVESGDPLRERTRIVDLLLLVSCAMEAHASADAWAGSFQDSESGVKWQELQLIASLLGVALAASVLGDSTEAELCNHEERLRALSGSEDWRRPEKTQTSSQLWFIAHVALGIVEELGVSVDQVHGAILARFGSSNVHALDALRSEPRPWLI